MITYGYCWMCGSILECENFDDEDNIPDWRIVENPSGKELVKIAFCGLKNCTIEKYIEKLYD